MSRAEDLAAKAARLRASQAPKPTTSQVAVEPESVEEPAEPTRAPQYVSTSVPEEPRPARATRQATPHVRTRPVRLTVDVSPADHAALARLALDAAADLGLARVHGQEIVRALIHRMFNEPDLQRRVLADVQATRLAR
jgi:hypothetical protein